MWLATWYSHCLNPLQTFVFPAIKIRNPNCRCLWTFKGSNLSDPSHFLSLIWMRVHSKYSITWLQLRPAAAESPAWYPFLYAFEINPLLQLFARFSPVGDVMKPSTVLLTWLLCLSPPTTRRQAPAFNANVAKKKRLDKKWHCACTITHIYLLCYEIFTLLPLFTLQN